jgi:hypothetical protein
MKHVDLQRSLARKVIALGLTAAPVALMGMHAAAPAYSATATGGFLGADSGSAPKITQKSGAGPTSPGESAKHTIGKPIYQLPPGETIGAPTFAPPPKETIGKPISQPAPKAGLLGS